MIFKSLLKQNLIALILKNVGIGKKFTILMITKKINLKHEIWCSSMGTKLFGRFYVLLKFKKKHQVNAKIVSSLINYTLEYGRIAGATVSVLYWLFSKTTANEVGTDINNTSRKKNNKSYGTKGSTTTRWSNMCSKF